MGADAGIQTTQSSSSAIPIGFKNFSVDNRHIVLRLNTVSECLGNIGLVKVRDEDLAVSTLKERSAKLNEPAASALSMTSTDKIVDSVKYALFKTAVDPPDPNCLNYQLYQQWTEFQQYPQERTILFVLNLVRILSIKYD
ncbi:hypothetical protein HDU77_010705 [Chytriomyces hyalinus]|nr:hypothetical protein HDU77_010705 [Chytriomyces hyalinus]